MTCLRAEQVGCQCERPAAQQLRWRLPTQSAVRKRILTAGVDQVDRNHLGSAATLHLERPEAIHRAHVKTAGSLQGRRPGHPGGRRPQVPRARRRHARSDLDHMPPAETSHGQLRVGNPGRVAHAVRLSRGAAIDTSPETPSRLYGTRRLGSETPSRLAHCCWWSQPWGSPSRAAERANSCTGAAGGPSVASKADRARLGGTRRGRLFARRGDVERLQSSLHQRRPLGQGVVVEPRRASGRAPGGLAASALIRAQSGAGFYRFAEAERIDVLRVIHTARSSDAWPT
jgi:hypothetical protein